MRVTMSVRFVMATVLAVSATTVALTMPVRATTTPLATVAVYGDSIAVQEAIYLYSDFSLKTTKVNVVALGGAALCDLVYPHYHVTGHASDPGAIMLTTKANAPTVAVIEFVGSIFTGCISPDATSASPYLANYSFMLHAAIAHLLSVGTRHVFVARGPLHADVGTIVSTEQSALAAAYQSVVNSFHSPAVSYLGGVDTALDPGNVFVAQMPCLTIEIRYGHCPSAPVGTVPMNPVRSSDGVHLCAVTTGDTTGHAPSICPVWDSGAFRIAAVIAKATWAYIPASAVDPASPVVTSVSPSHGSLSGHTVVVIKGWNLDRVTSVSFIKNFNPLIAGVAYYGAVQTRVVLSALHFTIVSSREIKAVSPALDATSPAAPQMTFVEVASPTQTSVYGLSTQRYDEP